MSVKSRDLAETFHIKDITTARMQAAIWRWYNLFYDVNIPADEDNSQRLANTIVDKISRAVFSEYEAESKDNNEFINSVLKALDKKRFDAMQHALIGGQCWLKPIVFGDEIKFSIVTRDNAVIFGRDDENNVVDIGTEEDTELRGVYYTLFERRYINDAGNLTIESRLFASDDRNTRGSRVPLATLNKYKDLEDIIELPVHSIGLVPLTCPAVNCVDGSDDPVSIYARAEGLIHNINVNEKQLIGEFDRGESRIIVSNDFLKSGIRGGRELADNLFVGIDDDPENVGFQIFSPQLREQSFLARKIEYLRNIENLIGLKRGLLSAVETMERTATEITSSAGDYNLTVMSFQNAWLDTVYKAIEVTAELCKAYRKPYKEAKEEDIVVNFGNGVLYDRDKTWAEYMTMVQSGLLKPEIAIAWYFNIDWKTDKDLEQIKKDYAPQLAGMLGLE